MRTPCVARVNAGQRSRKDCAGLVASAGGAAHGLLGVQLGGNVFAVCHVQQAGHLVDDRVFVHVEVVVGVGHFPHGFHHRNLLRLGEAFVEQAGEAVVVVGGARGFVRQLDQAVDLVVAELELAAQRADDSVALVLVQLRGGAHHLHQQHRGGQVQGVFVGGAAARARQIGGELVDEVLDGSEHGISNGRVDPTGRVRFRSARIMDRVHQLHPGHPETPDRHEGAWAGHAPRG